MKRLHIRPSRLLLLIALTISLGAFVAALLIRQFQWQQQAQFWYDIFWGVCIVLVLMVAYDYWKSRRAPPIKLNIVTPGSVSVDKWAPVKLLISHGFGRGFQLEICLLYSNIVEFADARFVLSLLPNENSE